VNAPGLPRDAYRAPRDPVTFEVVKNAFLDIAEQMGETLLRTAFSPVIAERLDASCAIFDARAEMVSQAEMVPVHIGAMPYAVAGLFRRIPPGTFEPGDIAIMNDPYHGNNHLPDVTVVKPVFYGGEALFFPVARGHWADTGGMVTGSFCVDATEIFQEGLRIPPVRLYRGGTLNRELLDLILLNVRDPVERRGDLDAQIATVNYAEARIVALLERYGRDVVLRTVEDIKAYSERRIRAGLAKLRDGTYEGEDPMDGDGRSVTPIRFHVVVRKQADAITLDFSGSDRQTSGATNAPISVTSAAAWFAVKSLTDPYAPPNHGCYRPIELIAPEGSVVNAAFPAAVASANSETCYRVLDVVYKALADITPEATAGSYGTMCSNVSSGMDRRTGRRFIFVENYCGGWGATAERDGRSGMKFGMSNSLSMPTELFETMYPIVLESRSIIPDSCGHGRRRGGCGIRYRHRIPDWAEDVRWTCIFERTETPPWGVQGGLPAAVTRIYVERADGRVETLREITGGRSSSKASDIAIGRGDVLVFETPGGGGFGDPRERDRDRVLADVLDGYVTRRAAAEIYGVTTDDPELDALARRRIAHHAQGTTRKEVV
jgi:N-methylhydantoinase B